MLEFAGERRYDANHGTTFHDGEPLIGSVNCD